MCSSAQLNLMMSHLSTMCFASRLFCFCCAPRGRSEEKKGAEPGEEVKIVAVDLQAMAPLPGVTQIQGDITKVAG